MYIYIYIYRHKGEASGRLLTTPPILPHNLERIRAEAKARGLLQILGLPTFAVEPPLPDSQPCPRH